MHLNPFPQKRNYFNRNDRTKQNNGAGRTNYAPNMGMEI